MLYILVWCSLGIVITVSGAVQVFEAPNLSTSQHIDVSVRSEIPAYITWNTTNETILSIRVEDGMLDDKQNDIVFNLDIRFEHNATHAVFVVQKSEKYSESVIRDVALASGRGNRAVLDAGQVFLLLWLTAVAGNWKHVFIVPAILIGSLAAHLLGQTFAHAEEDDKRRLLISILAPRDLSYRSISLVSQDGRIRFNGNETNVECMTDLLRETHTGCRQCCNWRGICSNDMCLCDKGYDGNTYCQIKKRVDVLFKHPLDPRLSYTELSSGEKFNVFVVHDVETDTIKPKMVAKLVSEQGSFQMEFDKNGQFKRINQNNGKNKTNLLISISKGCEIRVFSKISRNNKRLLKTLSLNTCKSNVASLSKNVRSNDFVMYTANLHKLQRLYFGISNHNSSTSNKYIKVKVKVESCGTERADGELSANIESANDHESNPLRIDIPVFRSQDGGYFFRLPNVSYSFEAEFEEKCSAVSGIITSICSSPFIGNKQLICSDLNDSVHEGSNTTKQDFEWSCRNLFDSVEKYCNQIKTNEWNLETNCIENYDDSRNIFETDELLFKPIVTFGGGKVINKFQQRVLLRNISLLGVSDIVVTDDKPKFRIIGVTVTPQDPLPLDLYQVRLDYACATNFTMIDMRINGSDLYSNYATCSGANQCNCCILHAAGAAGSVVDNIVINITDPWAGTNLIKTVMVVF